MKQIKKNDNTIFLKKIKNDNKYLLVTKHKLT